MIGTSDGFQYADKGDFVMERPVTAEKSDSEGTAKSAMNVSDSPGTGDLVRDFEIKHDANPNYSFTPEELGQVAKMLRLRTRPPEESLRYDPSNLDMKLEPGDTLPDHNQLRRVPWSLNTFPHLAMDQTRNPPLLTPDVLGDQMQGMVSGPGMVTKAYTPKIEFKPNPHMNDETKTDAFAGYSAKHVYVDGEPLVDLRTQQMGKDTLRIEWAGGLKQDKGYDVPVSRYAVGEIGPAINRAIFKKLQEENPDIKYITAYRVTGARENPTEVKYEITPAGRLKLVEQKSRKTEETQEGPSSPLRVKTDEEVNAFMNKLGEHADWDKFLTEARRSTNIEDDRDRKKGLMETLKSMILDITDQK